ncbi:RHS repeat-associated core domain-containing protein [Candidatus Margulisiibacteriota bacterium]
MKFKISIIILFLFFSSINLFASESAFVTGFNHAQFNNGDVNLPFGTVMFTATDLNLPGKNGLNLIISRTYNSSQYKSNPTADITFTKLWGGYAGKGWSFNFAKKAFLLKTYDTIGGISGCKIIIEGNGGFESYECISTSYSSEPLKFKSDQPNNFNNIYYYSDSNKIVLETTIGRKLIFSLPFYNEEQKNGETNLLLVKGFLINELSDLSNNKIIYSYEEFGTPISHTLTDNPLSETSLTNVIGKLYEAIKSYLDGQQDSDDTVDYNVNTTIQKQRLKTITDTYGNNININYADTWNESAENIDTMVTKISYKSVNGSSTELKYGYDTSGNMIFQQLGDLPKTEYSYTPYKPSFYKYSGTIGSHVTYEDWDSVQSRGGDNKQELSYYNGDLLEKIIDPLGKMVKYEYEDSLERKALLSIRSRDIPNASYPVVMKKSVYKNSSDINPEFSMTFAYPIEEYGHPDMKKFGSSSPYVYTFSSASIIHSHLGLTTHFYEKWMLKKKLKGIFSVINGWDYDNNRLDYVENYINSEKKSKISYTYNSSNNPTNIKIYKGNSASPYQETINTYWTSGSAFDNNFKHLVQSSKIVKNGKSYNEKYFEYTSNGKISKIYKGTSSAGNLEKEIEYHSDGRVKKQESGGISGYLEYEYSDTETERNITKKWIDGTEQYSETAILSPYTGQIKSFTDKNGHETNYTYDEYGRMTNVTYPDNSNKTYDFSDYFTNNKLSINTNGLYEITKYFDNFDRITSIITPDGIDNKYYTYHFGNKVDKEYKDSISDANKLIDYDYDIYLRPTNIWTKLGTTTYQYNDSENNVQITEFSGTSKARTITKTSNDFGQILSTDYMNTHTIYYDESKYNAFGNCEEIKDPRGLYHRFSTDTYGRVKNLYRTSNTAGSSVIETDFSYKSGSGLLEKEQTYTLTGTADKYYSYGYDNFGRLTSFDLSADNADAENYKYDSEGENTKGRIGKTENDDSKTIIDYDNMGRVKKQTVTIKPINKTYSMQTEYTDFGQIKSSVYPDNNKINYVYNSAQQLESVKYNDTIITSYEYNSNGTIKKMTYGNGYAINYAYGKEILVENIEVKDNNGNIYYTQGYNYDDAGNITKTVQPNTTRTYTYNNIDELEKTEVVKGANVLNYTYNYDKNGNPKTFSKMLISSGVKTATQTFDPKADRITSKTYPDGRTMTFSYDARGNLTTKTRAIGSTSYPTITYNYNYQNQLKAVKEGNTIIAEYSYDINKQLIYKNIIKSGYQTQKYYYWDLAGRIIGENNISTKKTTRYIYSGNEKIAFIHPDKNGNSQVYYFINNLQGTPIYIINANGKEKQMQLLDEFGNEELKTLGDDNLITFTGKQFEPATRLFYFNQRWYDPDTGRFLQTDPAAQGPNLYAYCANNPLIYIDPDGQILDWLFWMGLAYIIDAYAKDHNERNGAAKVDSSKGWGIGTSGPFIVDNQTGYDGRNNPGGVDPTYNLIKNQDEMILREIDWDISIYMSTPEVANSIYSEENEIAAYFALRPLKGLPWLGPLSNNRIDDRNNTEISHEQLFFEDKKGGNIGFTGDGTLRSDSNVHLYRKTKTGFNDSIIRRAVRNVPLKPYKALGGKQNNCQNWAEDVRQEYYRLLGN